MTYYTTTGYCLSQPPPYQPHCFEQQKHNTSQSMQHHYRPAFVAMERLVIICRELAHTLESNFMANHSRFSTLWQCMRQINADKRSLSNIFGFLSALRWIKNKILSSSKHASSLSIEEFEHYDATKRTHLAKTSLVIFAVLSFGVSLFAAHLKAHTANEAEPMTATLSNFEKDIETLLPPKENNPARKIKLCKKQI